MRNAVQGNETHLTEIPSMTAADKLFTFLYSIILSSIVASVGIVVLGAACYLRTR